MTSAVLARNTHDFRILKSDNLMIGGYASIEIVDKQNDLITLKALQEAVSKYMENPTSSTSVFHNFPVLSL